MAKGLFVIIVAIVGMGQSGYSYEDKLFEPHPCLKVISENKAYRFPYFPSWQNYLSSLATGNEVRQIRDFRQSLEHDFNRLAKLVRDTPSGIQFLREQRRWQDAASLTDDEQEISAQTALYRRTLDLSLQNGLAVEFNFQILEQEFGVPKFHDLFWVENMTFYAEQLALRAHGKQMYSATQPYSYHLHSTIKALDEFFQVDSAESKLTYGKVKLVLWLHDVIEDTNVSLVDIYYWFGQEIGTAVYSVTNLPKVSVEGLSQHETSLIDYQWQLTGKQLTRGSQLGRLAKIFDRISNMQNSINNCIAGERNCLEKYVTEWPLFRRLLYVEGEAELAWRELANLADHSSRIQRTQ